MKANLKSKREAAKKNNVEEEEEKMGIDTNNHL